MSYICCCLQNILITCFRKEISLKKKKIIVKFNVNFLSMGLKKTFPHNVCFFERAINFTISLYYNKNVGSSLRRDILCKVHIDQMNSFLQHFGIHSFHINFRILRDLRGAFRAISNIYDEAFSHCIISEMHHHKYLAR